MWRDSLARHLWSLERFGLTPHKLIGRIHNRTEPKILCVSLPKAGTHLLERALCLHPRMYRRVVPTLHDDNIDSWGGLGSLLNRLGPGQILVSHLHFRQEYRQLLARHAVRCVFLVRDPRDMLVSQSFYIASQRSHRLHRLFVAHPDLRSRLRLAITGDAAHRLPSIGERLASFAGWLEASDLVVRYEELLQAGNTANQPEAHATLLTLYHELGLDADEQVLQHVVRNLVSRASPTFRTGGRGEWKQHFDVETYALFEKTAEPYLPRYGY